MTTDTATNESQNVQKIRELLEKGVGTNTFHSSGQTLLIAMARKGEVEAIKILFDAGADLEQCDFHDKTALMYAVEADHEEVAQLLIDAGADVNAKNHQGRTALMYAAYKNNSEFIEILINAGAKVNFTDRKGYSALDYTYLRRNNESSSPRYLKKQGAKHGRKIKGTRKHWLRKVASFSEFEELKVLTTWRFLLNGQIASVKHLTWPLIFLNLVITVFANTMVFPAWIALPAIGVGLVRLFPSIPKITLLLKEKITNGTISLTTHEYSGNVEALVSTAAQDNLGFVSNILELGSNELKHIHVINSDQKTKMLHKKNEHSRLASLGLAVSIFMLSCFLYGPAALGYPLFTGTGNFLHAFLLVPLLPFWLVKALEFESGLRLERLKRVQIEKDRLAREISKVLYAEDFKGKKLPPDFALYLRAFMTTNKLIMNGLDLETVLAYSIAPVLPVIALGQPGEHLGAGRIQTSDEHWQEEIKRLFEKAKIIIIIPSHREGTLWEINNLKQSNYLSKTIFIMPPEMTFYGKPYSKTWNRAVKAAARHGVFLPTHFSKGLVFKLDKDGHMLSHAPFKVEEFEQELEGMEYTHSDPGYYDDASESVDVSGAISGMTKAAGMAAVAMKGSFDKDDDIADADDLGEDTSEGVASMDDSSEDSFDGLNDIFDGGDDVASTDDFGGDIFDGADDIFDTGDSFNDTFDGDYGDYGDHGDHGDHGDYGDHGYYGSYE